MNSKIRSSQNFSLINTDRAGTIMAIINALLAMSISLHAGTFDGPAELPRVYIQSSLANTPAPGKTLSVPAGGNIQAALNQASCGDTIRIQAGATFTGYYTFPAKKCDNAHWIIVRTSAPDTSLPPEGTRVKPCYAGVGSLPGRPAFNCTSTANVMVKLVTGNNLGSGPIVFAPGANHYRLIGLEVTRQLGGTGIYDLAFVPTGGAASYIVFDRMWLHGNAKDDTERGVLLSGLSNVAIVDSYFTDFHCTALTGSCSDAQAIAGASAPYQAAPIKSLITFSKLRQKTSCSAAGLRALPRRHRNSEKSPLQAFVVEARAAELCGRCERKSVRRQESL